MSIPTRENTHNRLLPAKKGCFHGVALIKVDVYSLGHPKLIPWIQDH
jgi:hypothetical protein